MTAAELGSALREDIAACGYFPDLVSDIVGTTVGDESLLGHLVHHEATFDRDALHRHLTVLALTDTRFIVCHVDEDDGKPGQMQAATTSEAVPLHALGTVSVATMVNHPQHHAAGRSEVAEVWLTVNWGALRQLDLKPAACDNPECEADHGYIGSATGEDLVLRMSVAADGKDSIAKMMQFATLLQARVGPR